MSKSHEYRLIYRWVEQGMPRGSATDPVPQQHQVLPHHAGDGSWQRPADHDFWAPYSDGTVEDVTRMALYPGQ
ncbi:MAG: hypothetical protein CM1200mP2_04090 [Planctomycetaceae bacterium]|nr:MAG: hypothetical protein CM1200mP2_04090 [Planctomycetaceae bacterium]